MNYVSDRIEIDSEWTILKPGFDIKYFSFISDSGDFDLQLRRNNSWGDIINGFKNIPLADEYGGVQLRIRAKEGEVSISYYLRGD